MLFSELQTEFFARGFDYLNDASTGLLRTKRWLNDAYHEICQTADWPFLETSVTAANPQTITDARRILTVHDATNHLPLRPTTHKWIVSMFGDVASTVGLGRFYWVDGSGSSLIVRTYPVISTSTTVYYLKVPADMSAGGDTPVVPSRFQDLIVDGAVKRAYEDSDNFQEAMALGQQIAARMENMRSVLMTEAPLPDVDDTAQATVPGNAPPVPPQ